MKRLFGIGRISLRTKLAFSVVLLMVMMAFAVKSSGMSPGAYANAGEGSSDGPARSADADKAVSQASGLQETGESQSVAVSPKRWNPDYSRLEEQLENYIWQLNREYGQEWGIYFIDLTSGEVFGINEDLPIPAASTVKVPVVLYASHLVSQGKLSWDEKLTYLSWRDYRTGAGSLQFTAKDGDTFSIRELCEKAIVESDNVAWKMLERRLGKDNIAAFMRELGGEVVYPDGENISTAKDLATYMLSALKFSQENPEGKKLIWDLSHTIWNTGLNRYTPPEVTVAHKEGDVNGVSNDVGIVYAQHPYIVAIMSKGQEDVEAGFEQIGTISKMIYDYQASL